MFEKHLWKSDILSKDAGRLHKFGIGRKWVNGHEYTVVSSTKLRSFVSLMKNIKSFTKRLSKTGLNINSCRIILRI